jgi:undecaprenyl-phosphate 4-deoxy-4-formamido-L-arabinose transferase
LPLSSLTIALPAFNEERIIEKTISSSKKAAEIITQDYEILVIDGGSKDRTKDIVESLSISDGRIKGVFLTCRGYGRALCEGFYSAKKDFIFYTDSDAPIDIIKELPRAASMISEEVDAVIGYRINREDIPLRKIYSMAYNFISRVLLGIRVRDVNFSCKLMRKRVFDKIKLYSNSAFIDAELLANLNLYGFKIKEFPATYVSRVHGYSNFDSPFYAIKLFFEMIIFWSKYYLFRNKLKHVSNV